jgi:hypothetical protein
MVKYLLVYTPQANFKPLQHLWQLHLPLLAAFSSSSHSHRPEQCNPSGAQLKDTYAAPKQYHQTPITVACCSWQPAAVSHWPCSSSS